MRVLDKQLRVVNLDEVRQIKEDGGSLTLKQWCALANYEYTRGLAISKKPGFPLFESRVAWRDWESWRRQKVGLDIAPADSLKAQKKQLEAAGSR